MKKSFVVFFLLGDSPASEFYVPTFREHCSIKFRSRGITQKKQHSQQGESLKSIIGFCYDLSFGWFPSVWILRTDVSVTLFHKAQKPGNHPKETTFTTRRKFEIEKRVLSRQSSVIYGWDSWWFTRCHIIDPAYNFQSTSHAEQCGNSIRRHAVTYRKRTIHAVKHYRPWRQRH